MRLDFAVCSVTALSLACATLAHADQRFQATLTGAQQASAVTTTARGVGTVLLNSAETEIAVTLNFSGLLSAANAAHIHGAAAAGTDAGVVFGFTSVPAGASGTIQQTFSITAGQVTSLKAGLFYLNVHSIGFPSGEIRGQLMAAPPQVFSAALTGSQQVPTAASAATGTGTVRLNALETEIAVDVSFTGLAGVPTGAHIHGPAAAGANAGVLFDFTSATPAASAGAISTQTFALSAAEVVQLKAGQFYFNIHNATYPGGEIRGQITLAPRQKFSVTLDGAQQVPPVSSSAAGTGTVLLNAAEDSITVNMTFTGLSSAANAAHIHGPAVPGANAGALFTLSGVPAAMSGSIPEQTFSISAGQVAQLKAGQFYVNIHTANLGGGELRGQIVLAPIQKFTASFTGAQQAPPTASSGTGTGTVWLNATQDEITVEAAYAGLSGSANAAHIHGPAAAGANAGVLFGLEGGAAAAAGRIPDQSFAITAAQVTDLRSGQHYFNVHSTALGGGEVRGQIGAMPMLTVAKGGTGTSAADITSSPVGIACGGDCAEAYPPATSVAVTAGTPAVGSYFAGWTGGCSGTGTCVVAPTADTTVTAVYSPTAFTFTDDPLVTGQTAVKAVHITELRTAISTLRTTYQVAAAAFTDVTLAANAVIKAVHITELRTALAEVYVKRARTVPSYTDPGITTSTTAVKAVHISELRAAARQIE